jgi:hypothetical protein
MLTVAAPGGCDTLSGARKHRPNRVTVLCIEGWSPRVGLEMGRCTQHFAMGRPGAGS